MRQIEIIPSRLMVAGGDFTDALFAYGAEQRSWVTGIFSEADAGVFQFALLVLNRGIGLSVRWAPGSWGDDDAPV